MSSTRQRQDNLIALEHTLDTVLGQPERPHGIRIEHELSTVIGEPTGEPAAPETGMHRDDIEAFFGLFGEDAPPELQEIVRQTEQTDTPTPIAPPTDAPTVIVRAEPGVVTAARRRAAARRLARVEDRLRALLAERETVRRRQTETEDPRDADTRDLADRVADLHFQILSLAHERDHLRRAVEGRETRDRVQVARDGRSSNTGADTHTDTDTDTDYVEGTGAPAAVDTAFEHRFDEAAARLTRRLKGITCASSLSAELADLNRLRTRLNQAVRLGNRDPRQRRLVLRLARVETEVAAILERLRRRETTIRAVLEHVGRTTDEETVRRALIQAEDLVPRDKAPVPQDVRIRLEVLEEARTRWESEREEMTACIIDGAWEAERMQHEVAARKASEETTRRLHRDDRQALDKAQTHVRELEARAQELASMNVHAEAETRRLAAHLDRVRSAAGEHEIHAANLTTRVRFMEGALAETAARAYAREQLFAERQAEREAEQETAHECTRDRLRAGAEFTSWLAGEVEREREIAASVRRSARRWKNKSRKLLVRLHGADQRAYDLQLERDAAALAAREHLERTELAQREAAEQRLAAEQARERAETAEEAREQARREADEQAQAGAALVQDKGRAVAEREEYRVRARNAETRAKEVEARLHDAQGQARDAEGQAHDAEDRIRELEADIEAAWSRAEAFERELEQARTERRTAGERMLDLQAHLAATEESLGETWQAADEAREQNEQAQGRITDLEADLEEARRTAHEQNEQAQDRIAHLETELEEARRAAHEAELDLDVVRGELDDAVDLGRILDTQRRDLENTIETLQAEAAEAQARFEEMEQRAAQAEERATEAEERAAEAEVELSDAIEAVAQAEETTDELRREIETLREQARAALAEVQATAEAAAQAEAKAAAANAAPAITTATEDLPARIVRAHAELFETLVHGQGISPLSLEPVVEALVTGLREHGYKVGTARTEPADLDRKALHLARVAALSLHLGLRNGYDAKDLRGLGTCALLHEADGLRWFLKAHGHDYARILRIAEAFETLTLPPRPEPAQPEGALPRTAMEKIVRGTAKGMFDKRFVKVFVESLSAWPVGSWVRLNDGKLGRVVASNGRNVQRPVVEVTEAGIVNRIDLALRQDVGIREAVAQP